jgi:hypothetical protein
VGIETYDILPEGVCSVCGCTEDIVIDEDGEMICIDCLFERRCAEMAYGKGPLE